MTLLVVVSFAAGSQRELGRGKRIARTYAKVKHFDKLAMYGSYDVIYTQGNTYKVVVKGREEVVDNLQMISDGHTLSISTKKNNKFSFTDGNVEIYVTSPQLNSVLLKGSGDFEAARIDADKIQLSLIGSGDIDVKNIKCEQLDVHLKGSGDVEIKRVECVNSTLHLKGSGDIDAYYSRCRQVTADLFGSGDIKISGRPGKIRKTVRGSGDITIKK